MALLGLGVILFSLMPLYVKSSVRGVGYTLTKVGILFDGQDLNRLVKYDDKNYAFSPAPGIANPQYGPRIVAINPSKNLNDGVTFDLPQTIKDNLAKKPAKSVVVVYHNDNNAPADFVSFAFVDKNGAVADFKVNPKGEKKTRFSFVANPKSLDKIIINPALEGEYHGIEVMTILIEN